MGSPRASRVPSHPPLQPGPPAFFPNGQYPSTCHCQHLRRSTPGAGNPDQDFGGRQTFSWYPPSVTLFPLLPILLSSPILTPILVVHTSRKCEPACEAQFPATKKATQILPRSPENQPWHPYPPATKPKPPAALPPQSQQFTPNAQAGPASPTPSSSESSSASSSPPPSSPSSTSAS